MTCGDPMCGLLVAGNLGAPTGQLISKSYRSRTRRQRWLGKPGKPLGQRTGCENQRLPKALSPWGVESGEDLAAARVEHGERVTAGSELRQPTAQSVERADTHCR